MLGPFLQSIFHRTGVAKAFHKAAPKLHTDKISPHLAGSNASKDALFKELESLRTSLCPLEKEEAAFSCCHTTVQISDCFEWNLHLSRQNFLIYGGHSRNK